MPPTVCRTSRSSTLLAALAWLDDVICVLSIRLRPHGHAWWLLPSLLHIRHAIMHNISYEYKYYVQLAICSYTLISTHRPERAYLNSSILVVGTKRHISWLIRHVYIQEAVNFVLGYSIVTRKGWTEPDCIYFDYIMRGLNRNYLVAAMTIECIRFWSKG